EQMRHFPADGSPIKLDQATSDGLNELMQDFENIFRRPMDKNEPVFFPATLLMSEDDCTDSIAAAMRAANVPPVLQYATNKTGRFVSNENKKYLTPDEIDEWNQAVNEFYELEANGFPDNRRSKCDRAADFLEEEFDRLPFIYSSFVQNANSEKRKC